MIEQKVDSFIEILAGDSSFSGDVGKNLVADIQQKTFKKGEIVQMKSDTIKNHYLVKSGLLRAYTIDSKGKEHIFVFAPEGWIVGDISDTLVEESLMLTIDALEDSVVEVFRTRDLDETLTEISNLGKEVTAREIKRLLKRMSVLQKRILMLLSYTAYERYEEFNKTYPGLVQRVPQKMIASYLGITPESLSKIKSQHLKNK